MLEKQEKKQEKQVLISSPAYIRMEIYKDGEGSFSLDSKTGWSWYGDTDNFLLGLLRVGSAHGEICNKFLEELEDEEVTKEDIKTAIKKSLQKDPSDGLYHLLGDNANYLGFGIFDEYADVDYSLEKCFEDKGIKKSKIRDVVNEIIFRASLKSPSTSEFFEKKEAELTRDMRPYANGSWKDVVNDAIDYCDIRYKDVSQFVECIWDRLIPLKEEISEDFISEYEYECRKSLTELSKDDIDEISKKTGVDKNKIEACIEVVV